MTLYIQTVATEDRCIIHEQWKGRIDQWQPRRRQQRRKRNTRSRIQKGKWGTRNASPKVFGAVFLIELKKTIPAAKISVSSTRGSATLGFTTALPTRFSTAGTIRVRA